MTVRYLLIILLFTLVGCSGDDDGKNNELPSIEGDWEFILDDIENSDETIYDVVMSIFQDGEIITLNFDEDAQSTGYVTIDNEINFSWPTYPLPVISENTPFYHCDGFISDHHSTMSLICTDYFGEKEVSVTAIKL